MKCRLGFVSNSSSSSFMLGIGKNIENKPTAEDEIAEFLFKKSKVDESSIFAPIIKRMCTLISQNCNSKEDNFLVECDFEEFCRDYFNDGYPSWKDLDDKYDIYMGSFRTDGVPGEEIVLAYSGLNFKDDALLLINDCY